MNSALGPMKQSLFRNKAIVVIVAALSIGGAMVVRLLRDGASDAGFVVLIAVAGVVAMAIVAPGMFTAGGDRPPWERRHEQDPNDKA